MGVIVTVAVVLVAWCACSLVAGVVIGRALALRPSEALPEPPRGAAAPTAARSGRP
jgi:hypothetical protein